MLTKLTVIVFLASALSVVPAQQDTRDASVVVPTPVTGTAVVSGVVLSADVHQPLRRVIVTLAGAALPIGRSAVTDDDGRFSIDQLPAGRFTLSATKPAYLPAAYGASRPGRPGIVLSVAAGQHVTDIALSMTHGAAIGGSIRDGKGQAVSGAQVSAIRALPGGAFSPALTSTYTDDRGEYRIFGLGPGDYLVSASQVSMFTTELGAMSSTDVDATFAALERRHAAPAGAPPPSLPRVRTVNPAPVFYPGTTNAAQAGRVTVAAGEDRSGTDITMEMARTAIVEGVIVYPAGPTPNVNLTISPRGPDVPVIVGLPPLQLRPGADGRFRFTSVNPGSYVIQALTSTAAPGRAGGSADTGGPILWGRADVDVNGDDVSGLTLTLQPGLHLSGRVVFDATTLTPPTDLTKLRVTASSASDAAVRRLTEVGLLAAAMAGPPPAPVAADGSFDLAGLAPGGYTVKVAPTPAGWWLRSAIVGGKDMLDAPFDVKQDGPAAQAVLTFSDRHTTLSGTVQTNAKQLASSYFIVVFSADRSFWRAASRRVQTTRAGTDGKYVVRDLPPGDYLIAVLTDFEPDDLLDSTAFSKLAGSALKVTLADGEQKTTDLQVGGA